MLAPEDESTSALNAALEQLSDDLERTIEKLQQLYHYRYLMALHMDALQRQAEEDEC